MAFNPLAKSKSDSDNIISFYAFVFSDVCPFVSFVLVDDVNVSSGFMAGKSITCTSYKSSVCESVL